MERQTSGSVVCPSCGRLVQVGASRCPMCGRPRPGLWGYARLLGRLGQDLGFLPLIIGTCALLYVLTLASDPSAIGFSGFGMLSPGTDSVLRFGASGGWPVFGLGRWWTLLSASWIHGSFLHILFNMLWVRQLAPATAQIYGPGRTVVIYVVSGVAGSLLTSAAGAFLPRIPLLGGAFITVGASDAVFGLLGALVHFGRHRGATALGRQAWSWALVLFVFGLVMPGVDNLAHLGGFIGGYAAGAIFNPLREERQEHLLLGLGLLLATALAVVASVLVPFPSLGG